MTDGASDGSRQRGEITLAFDLAAFKRLRDPPAVFADARRWSRYVGVVGDDREAVEGALAGYDLRQDYEMGEYDKQSVLSRLKWEADSPRYVYVGTEQIGEELAEYVGWEFITVREAAERAGWKLDHGGGLLAGVRAILRSKLL